MKNLRKPLCVIIALLLVFSVVSFSAVAEGEDSAQVKGEFSLTLYSKHSVDLKVEYVSDEVPLATVDNTAVAMAEINEISRSVEGDSTVVTYRLTVTGLSVGYTIVHINGGSFTDDKLGFTVEAPDTTTSSIKNEEKGVVSLKVPNDYMYIKYIAESTGTLKFTSDAKVKIVRLILDSGFKTLAKSEDSAPGTGYVAARVEAGKIYYIGISTNEETDGADINVQADFVSDTKDNTDTKPDILPDVIYPTQPGSNTNIKTDTGTDTKNNEKSEAKSDDKQSSDSSGNDDGQTVTKTIKLENSLVVFAKAKTVKAKKLRSKKIKFKAVSVKNASGKIKVSLVKKGTSKKIRKKIKVSKKGVITLKKGKYKKGKYKIKLKITAASSINTLTRTVILKIK